MSESVRRIEVLCARLARERRRLLVLLRQGLTAREAERRLLDAESEDRSRRVASESDAVPGLER